MPRSPWSFAARCASSMSSTPWAAAGQSATGIEQLAYDLSVLDLFDLRMVLKEPSTGMRTQEHVGRNLAAGDGVRLPPRLREALKAHRWERPEDTTP